MYNIHVLNLNSLNNILGVVMTVTTEKAYSKAPFLNFLAASLPIIMIIFYSSLVSRQAKVIYTNQ